jgi:glycosyltransferase involved in cell wall biosynthesis
MNWPCVLDKTLSISPTLPDTAAVRISVVVPAFNEEKLIAASLASINAARAAFEPLGWASELIVCDNNSTDRTSELAREAGATVVFEPVNQISRARNSGAAAATGDWLIFIDADSQPGAALFADVAAAIQRGDCLAGGSTVALDRAHWGLSVVLAGWNLISRLRTWAAGSFIFCETAAFREIGGFNGALFATEELDLSERLKKLARACGKKMIILRRHPLVTSSRKAHLYTIPEYLWFITRTVFSAGRTLKNRDACVPWYDGRR